MIELCSLECMANYIDSLTISELIRAWAIVAVPIAMFLTIIHESGHYYAAKLCGIDCKEFSLGSGPVILRINATPSGCKLAVRLIPLGGRVTYDDRWWQLSYPKRAFLSAAGWMADLISAFLILSLAYEFGAQTPIQTILVAYVILLITIGLTPITKDGRRVIQWFWMAAKERQWKGV
jgi:hypothetical protein